MTESETVHRLRGYADKSPGEMTSVKALLFGHLVERATPIVKHYQSDIFHDAIWIDKHLTDEPFTFFYGVRDTGTSIGCDEDLVRYSNRKVWRVTVYVNGTHWWVAAFQEV